MFLLLFCVLFPAVCCLSFLFLNRISDRRGRMAVLLSLQGIETLAAFWLVFSGEKATGNLVLTDQIQIGFSSDPLAKFFVFLIALGWLLVSIYATVYMKHEEKENRFFLFMLLSESAMMGAALSSNLVSMYLFYEMITLFSMPLVLHSLSKESVAAAKKYLYYSVAGAFFALFGIFVLATNAESLNFVLGGSLKEASPLVLTGALLICLGFGAKAGLFPLHGWLPTAHPVAPAPASALLSGLIAKAGVLAILRSVYYVIGAEKLFGSWVQTVLLILALLTVLMGSMMAYGEKVLKKRLAYSTVSQISYVLVGIFLFTPDGLYGAAWQILFHALVKIGLFLFAGAVIYLTGKTRVEELDGLGREMPITFVSFTILALSLIGIPPTGGFFSKWYLATASLGAETLGAFSWLIPAVLLLSALLTAGYLLSITIKAFFVKKESVSAIKEPLAMALPILILAALSLLGGIFAPQVGAALQALL